MFEFEFFAGIAGGVGIALIAAWSSGDSSSKAAAAPP